MSFEKKVHDKDVELEKLDISLLKFFWQTNPFLKSTRNTIPKFLKKIEILKNFTDLELQGLSRCLHKRSFDKGEVIFKESDQGVGFYFITRGLVDIVIEKDHSTNQQDEAKKISSSVVVTLERNDYFGELAMLQDKHVRNATAIAKEPCELLGLFKPDLDNMIHEKPVLAAKLLQSVSLITANRLYSITQEVRKLKEKNRILMEKKNEK